MKITRPLAAAGVITLAGSLVLLGAPAFAHVTVNPNTAEQGSYAKLTFRMPDESDTASTTKLEVQLPDGIDSARTKPVPGWKATLADGTLTWTADSAATAVKPGEFQEFDISVGPLPEVASLEFKALQTYSDGSVVRWVEETGADGAEPEHPAPVLTLTPAGADDTATAPAAADDTAAPADDSDDSDGDSKAPLVLSIIALVVAVAGAGAGLLRRRGA